MAEVTKGGGGPLKGVVGRMRGYVKPYQALFRVQEQREHMAHVVVGLTSDLERKSSEPIAVLLGLPRRVIQNFVGLCRWAWEPLRRLQRKEVSAEIGIADGTLILDGCGVPKKGTETVGVARQWCGRLGKVENCVVGVHAVYVGRDGQAAMVDSQVFLPKAWADDQARREKVYVPADVKGRTKVEIALDMALRMVKELPFSYVTADEEFGRSTAFRDGIRNALKWYVAEVPCNTMVRTVQGIGSARPRRADEVCKLIKRERQLTKILVAHGEKGPITVHAMMMEVSTARKRGRRVRETLLYTEDSNGEKKFYLAHVPEHATLVETVRRARTRHRVEEVFGEAKGEVGMDHFECRAWHGWHHHMTLVQISHWFLVREQRRLGKKMCRDIREPGPPSGSQNDGTALDSMPNTPVARPPSHTQRRSPAGKVRSAGPRAAAAPLAVGLGVA